MHNRVKLDLKVLKEIKEHLERKDEEDSWDRLAPME